MAAAPTVAAVLGDVLWCLGLGCLLGIWRDGLGLVFGNGPVRCFCWDVLSFGMAAVLVCGFSAGVSAAGVARWYMAGAMLAGVLAWHWTVQPAVRTVLGLLGRAMLFPLRLVAQRLLQPCRNRLAAIGHRFAGRLAAKKVRKKPKNGKKQLQRTSKIVYN